MDSTFGILLIGVAIGFIGGVIAEKQRNKNTPSASQRNIIRYEENHPCFCDNYSKCKLKANPIPCFRRSEELTPTLVHRHSCKGCPEYGLERDCSGKCPPEMGGA